MARPNITVAATAGFKVVRFEIPGGVTTPEEFAAATAGIVDRLPGPEVVLVTGRGPVWGYAMLVHAAHPTPAVATYDPRLGYVVVATHDPRYAVGQILPDPEPSA